jgi:hypothetical protein
VAPLWTCSGDVTYGSGGKAPGPPSEREYPTHHSAPSLEIYFEEPMTVNRKTEDLGGTMKRLPNVQRRSS